MSAAGISPVHHMIRHVIALQCGILPSQCADEYPCPQYKSLSKHLHTLSCATCQCVFENTYTLDLVGLYAYMSDLVQSVF